MIWDFITELFSLSARAELARKQHKYCKGLFLGNAFQNFTLFWSKAGVCLAELAFSTLRVTPTDKTVPHLPFLGASMKPGTIC